MLFLFYFFSLLSSLEFINIMKNDKSKTWKKILKNSCVTYVVV